MADSNATYRTSITVDIPDFPGAVVSWKNSAYFTSGNNEIFPGQSYDLTLDANGQGTQVLPCPDNTGASAVNWYIALPSKQTPERAIAYSATPQALSDILAAGSTTTDPDNITAALANKANKVNGGTTENIVTLTADGDIQDGGTALSTVTDHIANIDNPHMVQALQVGALAIANNLADLNNEATARTNLDVYGTGDFSPAPTAAEPLKADGTGGITIDHLGISGVDESITLPKSGSGEHIMLVSDPTTNASGSRIVSNGSQGQQLIFDLDFGNLSNFEEFKIRFNNSQVPFVVTRLYQVGVNQPTPTGQMDVVNGSASRIVMILKAFSAQNVDVLVLQDSAGATMTSFAKNGAWKPPSLADTAAENNTVYYSTTQSRLVYKDSGGVVNNLY